MNITEILELATSYHHLSPDRILLSQQVSQDVAVRRAVATQIALSSNLSKKLPTWADVNAYIPRHINLEQASSEATALYKRHFVKADDVLLDLTGGMGVDFWAMASVCRYAHYTEQDEELYIASEHNLAQLLPADRYQMHRRDSMEQLEGLILDNKPSLIYVDPARRAEGQTHQRVYAIEDCSPSLYDIITRLEVMRPEPMPRLLVKLSPMLDIKYCLQNIPHLQSLTVVAHRGEVKELLLDIRLDSEPLKGELISLEAVDILPSGAVQSFCGTWQEEASPCLIATEGLGRYLYEPNAALMKLGLFNLIGRSYEITKLHPHTQLYTTDGYIKDFPGRIFAIEEVLPYQSRLIKSLNKSLKGAQISCRNFPLSPEQLRQKLRLKESSDITLFATRLIDDSLVLLRCRRP